MHAGSAYATRVKIVLTPDSFKGSLSAREVARAMTSGIRRVLPDANIVELPIADGGEGTIDALVGTGGRQYPVPVRSASGTPAMAPVAILEDGTGVLEVAAIVGITDPAGMSVPLKNRTTRGVGDGIRALLDRGVKRIYIGLGGSSTSDGGAGMIEALGARLVDANGHPVAPEPGQLDRVHDVDLSGLDVRLAQTEIILLCDVRNPLAGRNGAAAIFGAQKGGSPDQLREIDAAVSHYAKAMEQAFNANAATLEGAGAAGGLGFALLLLGASARNGATVVLGAQDFDRVISNADWHITGEGRSDLQSICGKAPLIAALRASKAGVPTTLISGSVDPDAMHELAHRFAGCFSVTPGPVSLDVAIRNAADFVAHATEQLTRLRFAQTPRSATADRQP
ncbi:Glycerate kinase [Paraburkholderia piptadeniae]|uniref:Glycerate kinase n=1 Tax=Paraburkholderia piptadeniae TaxID=1701573 RepID=A0A1N7SPE9_9BURK|nr:glycerate kinase [Paraburkholderia piptadeniae]SIT49319.1 Glycerate kinase [Paraburkholderia piptadeniae]